MEYSNLILEHYRTQWRNEPQIYLWEKGPIEKLPSIFRVLEFPPSKSRSMWTYATCGMSNLDKLNPIELHIFSSKKDDTIIELLTAITYYHNNSSSLNLGHTVNFGKSWQDNSKCKFGLISLPYLDGPGLENFNLSDLVVKCYWLVPITEEEVEYKRNNGMEALEEQFDSAQFNYIDPSRKSVV